MSTPAGLGLLSGAARLFGLPDPALPAAALAAVRPDELITLAAELTPLVDGLEHAAGVAGAAADTVRRSWSAEPPGAAVGRLGHDADDVRTVVAAIREAAGSTADALAAAVADGTAALAQAQQATAGWPPDLLLAPFGLAAGTDPRAGQVIADLLTLQTDLDTALVRARAAADAAIGRLTEDPRDGLARYRGLSVPGSGRPATDPAAVDADNRRRLAADLLSADPHRHALAASVQAVLTARAGPVPVQLLIYQPDAFGGQGRVAIGLGDLADADNLAVLTPGIGNSPMGSVPLLELAERLRIAATTGDPSAKTTVVLWLGYDIPMSVGQDGITDRRTAIADVTAALSANNAVAGSTLLAADVERFTAMAPPSVLVTLLGHSMGSVVTSEAARRSIPADNLVLLGAPGAGPDVTSAADYRTVSQGHVFVGSRDGDIVTTPVTDVGALLGGAWFTGAVRPKPFGPDPAAAGFDAQNLELGPSKVPPPDPIQVLSWGVHQHGLAGYLSGTGLTAAAAVVTGRYRSVRTRRGR
jgi:hypothetical protein